MTALVSWLLSFPAQLVVGTYSDIWERMNAGLGAMWLVIGAITFVLFFIDELKKHSKEM
jgi:hypothetical protein